MKFRYYQGVRYVAPHKPAPPTFARCGSCGRAWDDDKPTGLTPAPSDMERTVVYIVRRDSADGPENDVFLDYTLAREWAKHIGASVEEETEIDRETLNAMKEAQS